jgi:tRNA pseudouridine55 synthase
MALPLDRLAVLAKLGELADIVISPYDALAHLPDLQVNDRGRALVANGVVPEPDEFYGLPATPLRQGQRVRISLEKRLLAVAEITMGNNQGMRFMRVIQ